MILLFESRRARPFQRTQTRSLTTGQFKRIPIAGRSFRLRGRHPEPPRRCAPPLLSQGGEPGYPAIIGKDNISRETGKADEHGGGRVRIAYLWQDAADQLRIDTAGLRRIRPDLEKFNYPLPVGHG